MTAERDAQAREEGGARGSTRLATPITTRDHVQGPRSAPVTIVEYGDYECPYCRAAVPIVQELQGILGAQLRYVFRHFPLRTQHPHAEHAAELAEAAGAQGKFFEMHRLLYERQNALDDAHLLEYAAELELNADRVRRELKGHVYAGRVREDFQDGLRSGVNGTPTFFIDGVRYEWVIGVRQLLDAIHSAHPDVVTDAMTAQLPQRLIPRVVEHSTQLRRHRSRSSAVR